MAIRIIPFCNYSLIYKVYLNIVNNIFLKVKLVEILIN
jgi:hypothetical protein